MSPLLIALLIFQLVTPTSAFLPHLERRRAIPMKKNLVQQRHASITAASVTAPHLSLDSQLLMDLTIAGALSLGVEPLVGMIYNETNPIRTGENVQDKDFRNTLLFSAANNISIAARVFVAVVLLDLVVEAFHLQLPVQEADLRKLAPQVALTVWIAESIKTIKRTIFLQSVAGNRLGRVDLYDKLIDFVITLVTLSFVLNELSVDIGMGIQSIFTAGGVGAIVFSLASKDLAEQIVGGFVVRAWDAFAVGDDVKLEEGIEGTVRKIGLVETEITGYDNIVIRIPNSRLTNQHVSNLSLIKCSQVKQLLRFRYSDLSQLPDVLNDIKEEIKSSCPKLIVDGSKPFQVVLSKYEADHVQVLVNCHFNIPPCTGEYVDNRQEVLLAIARAVETNGVDFALPSILYETTGTTNSNLLS